jgi:hypothetical protein
MKVVPLQACHERPILHAASTISHDAFMELQRRPAIAKGWWSRGRSRLILLING